MGLILTSSNYPVYFNLIITKVAIKTNFKADAKLEDVCIVNNAFRNVRTKNCIIYSTYLRLYLKTYIVNNNIISQL
jgi:hypothetical protein